MADDITTKILEIQINYSDAIEKIAQYRIEIEKVKAKQKELKDQLKEGKISEEEYHKSMEASKQIMSQLTNAVGTLSKQVKNQLKVQKEQEGSLVQWRAKLSSLTAEYDRLSKAEREGAKGQELKNKINEVTTALKEAEEGTQRYYRNVGNYPRSMQPMREQLDILVEKMKNMKDAGEENTPMFQALATRAEELRDKLAETSEENEGSFNKMNNGVMGLVAVFATWHTALDGLGIKNADFNKTLSICMTGITGAVTAGKLWNSVQKESAIMTVATTAKTWLLNTALAAKITATTAATTATGAATAATWLWNAALYANPLVWLIAIIAAAIGAVYGLIKVFGLFTDSNEKAKASMQQTLTQLESMHEWHQKLIKSAQDWGASIAEVHRMTVQFAEDEMKRYDNLYSRMSELYESDSDEWKDYIEKKTKASEDFCDNWEDANRQVSKIICGMYQDELKERIGDHEYKLRQIDEEIDAWITLARTLEATYQGDPSILRTEEKIADLEKLRARKKADLEKEEKKKAASDAKSAAEARKKKEDEEKKRQEEYYKELEKSQDALLALIKDGLDKQLQAEKLAYQRGLKALQDKLAKYKTNSEYDVKMRQAINDQIYALTTAHERRVAEFEWNEHQRRIKINQEMLQSKLKLIQNDNDQELVLKLQLLETEQQLEIDAINKRIEDGLITQEQGNALKLDMEEQYRQSKIALAEEYDQKDLEKKRAALQAEIDAMQLAEDERQLKMRNGWQMSDEAYAEWRQHGLEGLEEHERELLQKQEEAAQAELEALIARGQLSTQTVEQYEAEILAAKQKSQQAQAKTNDAIVKNEQAKAQAMKAVTSSLTGLLDTLGESNQAFAKMSKIITLAQIAIDTGKALSAGIASASSMPFPSNIAAIATTVATVLANVATAIQTVKSAKFAQGGKVTGPGTGTSDSIPAYLSNGEFVMTAQATKMFEPLLVAMNGIGKGVPMASPMSADRITTAEMMTNSFESAAREIRPVVSAVEITEVQNRVTVIENLDTFE